MGKAGEETKDWLKGLGSLVDFRESEGELDQAQGRYEDQAGLASDIHKSTMQGLADGSLAYGSAATPWDMTPEEQAYQQALANLQGLQAQQEQQGGRLADAQRYVSDRTADSAAMDQNLFNYVMSTEGVGDAARANGIDSAESLKSFLDSGGKLSYTYDGINQVADKNSLRANLEANTGNSMGTVATKTRRRERDIDPRTGRADPMQRKMRGGAAEAIVNRAEGNATMGARPDYSAEIAEAEAALAAAEQGIDLGAYNAKLADPTSGHLDYTLLGDSEAAQAEMDPLYLEAQNRAIEGLQNIYDAGGYTDVEQAQMRKVQRDAALAEKAQRDAVLQQARMRGMGGSGVELAGQLAAQQGGANRAAQWTDDIAIAGQQRALQALQGSANQAAQTGQQQFNQAYQKGSAADAFNNNNTQFQRGLLAGQTDASNATKDAVKGGMQQFYNNTMGTTSGAAGVDQSQSAQKANITQQYRGDLANIASGVLS